MSIQNFKTFKEFLEKMGQYIHIDDERPPKEIGAIWIKNYNDALNWVNNLSEKDKIFRVNFDNDIADETPGHDGYDILKRLLSKVLEGLEIPSEIMIHTQNSENRKAMMNYIQNFCRATDLGFNIRKEKEIIHNQELNRDFIIDGIVFIFNKELDF